MSKNENGKDHVWFPAEHGVESVPDWYPELFDAVADRVQVGRQRAVVAASQELASTYWHVGQEIVARMEFEGRGARVVDRLAADLRARFPDAKGFSPRNLRYMRRFAESWPESAILQAPLARLPWYHHIALAFPQSKNLKPSSTMRSTTGKPHDWIQQSSLGTRPVDVDSTRRNRDRTVGVGKAVLTPARVDCGRWFKSPRTSG